MSVFLEADNVTYVGDDPFNNTRNGKTSRPVIADPSGTGINQAYVRFNTGNVTTTAGRQRINRGTQRFIGGVGWRQNEQTYDALDVSFATSDLTASYAFVNRVDRLFGPKDGAAAATFDSNSHLLDVKFSPEHIGTITGYGYWLDFDNAAALSTRTFGARYDRSFDVGAYSVPLAIEYAHQTEHGDNPRDYSASYRLVQISIKRGDSAVSLGNEVLEGTPSGVFVTPLATLHKFQGWADKFLGTPAGGIVDTFVTGSTKVSGFKLNAAYHDFEADLGNADYGREIDISVSRALNQNVSLLFKLARYDAEDLATDTTKAWLMATITF